MNLKKSFGWLTLSWDSTLYEMAKKKKQAKRSHKEIQRCDGEEEIGEIETCDEIKY